MAVLFCKQAIIQSADHRRQQQSVRLLKQPQTIDKQPGQQQQGQN
jgi:hypothetical protein